MIALEIEILMIVAPWSSPVAASARTWTRGVFDNGISVYGFNITLTIPPYDYLDVEGLAGSGMWLTQRLRHKTDSEHGLFGFVQQLHVSFGILFEAA
jgi:hypothetical protein